MRAQPRAEGDPRRRRQPHGRRDPARRRRYIGPERRPLPRLPRQAVRTPARYVGREDVPVPVARSTCRTRRSSLPADRNAKKPAWLNDSTKYHDRGDINFDSCSEACFEQGDFYGLDDLFTEQPAVVNGLAKIYADWVTKYKLDGFRIDTAQARQRRVLRLWVPKILAAARSGGGHRTSRCSARSRTNDATDLATYVRDRGLPNVLDFPFQDAAAGYASGTSSALGLAHRLDDDDYFRTPTGIAPTPATFLGNHDMGRAAFQIQSRSHAEGDALLRAGAARLRPPLPAARRAGRLLRRRGRDDRLGRRQAGPRGHVPDAGGRRGRRSPGSARRRSATARRST